MIILFGEQLLLLDDDIRNLYLLDGSMLCDELVLVPDDMSDELLSLLLDESMKYTQLLMEVCVTG